MTTTSLPEENAATLSPISASTRLIIDIALGKIEKPRKFALWTHPVSFYLFLSAIVCLLIALIIVGATLLFPLEMSRPAAKPYILFFTDLMLVFVFLYQLSVVIVGISEASHPVRGHIRVLQTRIADEDEIITRLLEFDIASLQRASRRLALERETLLHRASSIVGEIGKTGVITTAAALLALFIHYRVSLQTDSAYVDGIALIILGFIINAMIANHIASRIRVAQYVIEEAIIEKRGLRQSAGEAEAPSS